MSRLVRLTATATLVIAVALPSAPAVANGGSTPTLGKRLVNRYLSAFQDRDIPALRRFLSPAWQLQRADGSRLTKSSFLRDVPTLRSYKMRRLRTTRAAHVVVVTLQVDSDLVVDGKPYRTGYAPRLATFIFTAKGWRMTSYANFNTPA